MPEREDNIRKHEN